MPNGQRADYEKPSEGIADWLVDGLVKGSCPLTGLCTFLRAEGISFYLAKLYKKGGDEHGY
jgi:hypothetical protein